MLKTVRSTLLALGFLSLAIPALASTIMIEPWTYPLQPNPCLEDTHAEVLFIGPYCDGTTCPPGVIRLGPCNGGADTDYSDLLPTPLGNLTRFVTVSGDAVSANIRPANQRITFKHGAIPALYLQINYSKYPYSLYDLAAHGVDQLQFEVIGSSALAAPLVLNVWLWGDPGLARITRTLTEPGLVELPLTEFVPSPGFDFRVAEITIALTNCPDSDCNTPPPPIPSPGEFSIGPISFRSTLPTPTKHRSWAQVKSIYR